MEVLFIMALVSGVVALIVKKIQGHQRQVAEAWQVAAKQLGMSFTPGSMTRPKLIQGEMYENRVVLDTFKRSSGKSSTIHTRYRVYFPEPLGFGLHVKQQGLMAGVATFFGAQDIEVGDAQFDSQVIVKGNDPGGVAQFLTPSRRLRILRLFEDFPGCEIKDQSIEWSQQGNTKQTALLVGTVRRLSFAATRLRENAESEREEETTEAVEPAVVETEPVVETVVAVPADGFDVSTVCKELFGSKLMGFDARRLFDERYKNHNVRWSGKIRRVTSYEIDMDFKGAPGTKLALDLAEVVGAFGRTAQAVIQLPRDAIEDLRSRTGERVTFEGTLQSCDVMMRNFFIVDSHLV